MKMKSNQNKSNQNKSNQNKSNQNKSNQNKFNQVSDQIIMSENKLKRNISVSYLYNFFMQLDITAAIWVLYLAFKGMSLVEIGILEAIYHVTSVLFELPTGAIADLYGKKFSIILGRLISIISCILYIVSGSFWGFALAFILGAASRNLHSGAAEALVYDSLKELGQEDRYKRIWGNLAFVMSIAQGIAVLLGGVLADIKFLYAYLAGTAIQIAAFILAGWFTELPGKPSEKEDCNVINQVVTSARVLKTRKIVLYIILFSALVGSLQTTVYFYSQSYFSDMNYTKTIIAILCALSSLIEATSSKFAYQFEKILKLRGSLLAIAAINIISLLGLALSKNLSIVFFLATSVSGGFAYTVFSDYINSRIPSEQRATILSFDSLIFSMFMVCVFPIFGLLAQYLGFSLTFSIIALVYIPIMVFLMIKLKKLYK